MKKWIIYICLAITLGVGVWLFSRHVDSETLAPPRVDKVAKGNSLLDLKSLKGKYVLVNFWDSNNAVSRIATGEYDRFFREHKNQGMTMVSVNTDDDRGLFSEIARKDGFDISAQYHIADVRHGSLRQGYKADEGYTSYLVNPDGKIVATNPTIGTLEKFIVAR